MWASSPGPGRPFSIGNSGAGAWNTFSHSRQAYLGRTCRITLSLAGIFSSTSVTISPSLARRAGSQLSQLQTISGSCTTTSRGRCGGRGLRADFSRGLNARRRSGSGRAAICSPTSSSQSSSRISSWAMSLSNLSEDWP